MNEEVRKRICEMTDKADDLLFNLKDEDYNSGNIDITDMFPFGWYSAYTFINKHLNRLVSLYASEKEPNFESIEDNWIDLLNYVRLGYAILHVRGELHAYEKEEKKETEG